MAKNKAFDQTAIETVDNFNDYEQRLAELAISMFRWEGLPDSIDARFMELVLFGQGKVIFFKDDAMDNYLALRCMAAGPFNVYNIPITRTAYAANGYQNQLNENDSVIIWNNLLHSNTFPLIQRKAKQLYEIDNIIKVNVKAQKTPVMLFGDEDSLLTLKNIYLKYDGNQPVMLVSKSMNPNDIKALNTGAPYVADKLYQLKTQYWNEALTILGISNSNFQKKERLITDEMIRSQGGIIANRYSRLKARRYACDEINKMFGLNISVDFEDDFREADDEVMMRGETGNKHGEAMTDMVVDLRTQ